MSQGLGSTQTAAVVCSWAQQCCVFCRTVREIRRDMHKQREWRNELDKMKIGNIVGCLNVESKTLRNSLVPITTRTLDQVSARVLLDTPLSHNSARLTPAQADTCLTVRRQIRSEDLLASIGLCLVHLQHLLLTLASSTEHNCQDGDCAPADQDAAAVAGARQLHERAGQPAGPDPHAARAAC